ASELWLQNTPAAPADVVAATAGEESAPVVVTMPRGGGSLMVSGAMDAWRFRAANGGAFDRFWQAAVAGLALAAAPPLDVEVSPSPLRPGQRADVIVRARNADAGVRMSATVDGRPIRLLPDAEPGVYRGEMIAAAAPGRAIVRATMADGGGHAAARMVPVTADARAPSGAALPLAWLASGH